MLAQEAIEKIEQELERLEFEYNMWDEAYNSAVKADYNRASRLYKEHMERLKAELDPLSIILESARLLHHHILEPSRQEEWRGKSGERLSVLYDIPEERIEIMADDLEKIGIKEGAD